MRLKLCQCCKQEKPITNFHPRDVDVTYVSCNECPDIWDEAALLRNKTSALKRAYSVYLKRFNGQHCESFDVVAEKLLSGCEICGEKNNYRRLNMDHCHETGKYRGFLCTRCNFLIGRGNDSIELFSGIVAYLKKYE